MNQYVDEIALEIEMMYLRRIMREIPSYEANTQGLVDAGLSNIQWKMISDYVCHYVSDRCDKHTLKKCREYFNGKNKTLQEHRETALHLAADNGGILPKYIWLLNNGFPDLCNALLKHPDIFADILQEKHRKTPQEHRQTALRLAKEYGGMLPNNSRLVKIDSNLVDCMYRHPEFFEDIRQEKCRKTFQEHRDTVLRLAAENDGILYSTTELREKGFDYLVTAMMNNPDIRDGIPQIPSRKSSQERLETVQSLAQEHGGIIPSRTWFMDNECNGLYKYIMKHLKMFHGFKMYKHGKIIIL